MAISVKEHLTPRAVADARQSILRRLMTYGAERRRLEQRLTMIAELEKEFQELLREVDHRDQPLLIKEAPPQEEPSQELYNNALLKELLQRALKAGPKTLDDLVRIAHQAKVNFGEKAPARVLHFDLLNLKNAGLIERQGDAWKLVERNG